MEILVLGVILFLSLLIIPLGLPGTWVMLAAGVGYSLLVPNSIGIFVLTCVTIVAVIAEVFEFTLSGKYAKKYGGSRRAGWGAIIGGTIGAFAGVPVPLIGPIIGAFAGSFIGALAMELSRGTDVQGSTRVAWGALVGRAVAAALKVAAGCVIAAWLLLAAIA